MLAPSGFGRGPLPPMGSKPVLLVFPVPRVACAHCGGVRQVRIPFAGKRRTYTATFERYVVDLSRHMTINDVARHLGVGWYIVKDIQSRYLTVVLDLATGAVVFVGEGKGAEALTPFWERLRRSRARVNAVAIDMSPAYIAAVQENLPGVVIVFDHFHVIQLFNDKLSNLRRDLQREATELLHKDVLKGTRWLLLKNPENLNPQRGERDRLEEALQLNKPLAAAASRRKSPR